MGSSSLVRMSHGVVAVPEVDRELVGVVVVAVAQATTTGGHRLGVHLLGPPLPVALAVGVEVRHDDVLLAEGLGVVELRLELRRVEVGAAGDGADAVVARGGPDASRVELSLELGRGVEAGRRVEAGPLHALVAELRELVELLQDAGVGRHGRAQRVELDADQVGPHPVPAVAVAVALAGVLAGLGCQGRGACGEHGGSCCARHGTADQAAAAGALPLERLAQGGVAVISETHVLPSSWFSRGVLGMSVVDGKEAGLRRTRGDPGPPHLGSAGRLEDDLVGPAERGLGAGVGVLGDEDGREVVGRRVVALRAPWW